MSSALLHTRALSRAVMPSKAIFWNSFLLSMAWVSWATRKVETSLWNYQERWPLNAESEHYLKFPSSDCPGWFCVKTFSKSFFAACCWSCEFLAQFRWCHSGTGGKSQRHHCPLLGLPPKAAESFPLVKWVSSDQQQPEQHFVLQAASSQEVENVPFLLFPWLYLCVAA